MFDAIVESCQRLFAGRAVTLVFPRDDVLESVAYSGEQGDRRGANVFEPWPLDRQSGAGTCILDSCVINVADTAQASERFPRMRDLALKLGYRSALFVPLLRDGKAIGCIAILRAPTGEFDVQEISLAQTFADQAVIAIQNARLFNETKEALERQTATAEVLRVISESPTDVQPVLDAVAQRAGLLCRADGARIWLLRDGQLSPMSTYGELYRGQPVGETLAVSPRSVAGRAVLERRSIHVEDLQRVAESEYPDVANLQKRFGSRTVLCVPLMWEGQALGVISLLRNEVRPFPPAEITLLQTFADQAVIAIQNARLFNETKEALERQTATAEVLRVISESPTDVQPVLDAVAQRAGLLCHADGGRIWLMDNGQLRAMTSYGPAYQSSHGETLAVSPKSIGGRVVLERRLIHVEDVMPLIETEYPDIADLQERYGFRTVLNVPLMWEGQVLGVISLLRNEVRPFAPDGDHVAPDLCRPGGDRDPERAAVQRDQGSARTADARRPTSCGSSASRPPTFSRSSTRSRSGR